VLAAGFTSSHITRWRGAKNSAQGLRISASVDLGSTAIHTLQELETALKSQLKLNILVMQ